MSKKEPGRRRLQSEPAIYEIVVQGSLSIRWADWFGAPLSWTTNDGEQEQTRLCLPVVDQGALLGHLQHLTDLGYPLLLIRRTDNPGDEGGKDHE